jgi:hypothetical protein
MTKINRFIISIISFCYLKYYSTETIINLGINTQTNTITNYNEFPNVFYISIILGRKSSISHSK